MFYLTQEQFDADTKHMTHKRTDGAQAMIKCVQTTHGMMTGNKYAVLVQESRGNAATTKRPYKASYHASGRGEHAMTQMDKWLKDNGFETIVQEQEAEADRDKTAIVWS